MSKPFRILVVGATGSIGRHVVDAAIRKGHHVRILTRHLANVRRLAGTAETVVGDLTQPETLTAAVAGMDAVVFTHGSGGGPVETEAIDYGGVKNVLGALGYRKVRIALMTSIGVTNRTGSYNRSTEAHDWKRRSERLVRASGNPYTIVRPGWFDYNGPDEHGLLMLQGDTRQSGTPSDGAIGRKELARVLVESLSTPEAIDKTFELVARSGRAPADLAALFRGVQADQRGALDGVGDLDNMPLNAEPRRVVAHLMAIRTRPPSVPPRPASGNTQEIAS